MTGLRQLASLARDVTLPAVVSDAQAGPGERRIIEKLAERLTNRGEAARVQLRD